MGDDVLLLRRDGWVAAWVDDDLIMMHASSNNYLSLSGSGGRIWELLERPRSISQLCLVLAAEYEIDPETARKEVRAFVDELVSRQALDVYHASET